MERQIRYLVLEEEQEEEDGDTITANDNSSTPVPPTSQSVPVSNVTTAPTVVPTSSASPSVVPPPAYEETEGDGELATADSFHQRLQQQQHLLESQDQQKAGQTTFADPCGAGLPPSYAVATDLPSYEEAERLKREEEHAGGGINPSGHHSPQFRSLPDEEHYIGVPDDASDQLSNADRLNSSGMTIGTDWIFFCTFVISFLFNWLGFLMSLCITNTVAGRCGALAGLGLSMVKWVAIVKHSGFAGDLAAGESWLWWILMLCGFLLFIRGCMQYVNVKYEWKRITGRLHHFSLF